MLSLSTTQSVWFSTKCTFCLGKCITCIYLAWKCLKFTANQCEKLKTPLWPGISTDLGNSCTSWFTKFTGFCISESWSSQICFVLFRRCSRCWSSAGVDKEMPCEDSYRWVVHCSPGPAQQNSHNFSSSPYWNGAPFSHMRFFFYATSFKQGGFSFASSQGFFLFEIVVCLESRLVQLPYLLNILRPLKREGKFIIGS